MFTCGFFNSINGDRKYNSVELSSIFDGIIVDGVFAHYGTHFATTLTTGRNINIGSGRCWFKHVWGLNDGNTSVNISPADVSQDRKDAIVIEIDARDEVRNAFIKVIEGPLGGNAPTLSNTEYFNQYPIAYVTVPAGSTSVTASQIQNVVGTSACPFATGVLETVNIDTLFSQWDAQFTEWFSDIQAQLDDNVVTNLINQINQLRNESATKQELAEVAADNDIVVINGVKYKPLITEIPNTLLCDLWYNPTGYTLKPNGLTAYGISIVDGNVCYIGPFSSLISIVLAPKDSDPIVISVTNPYYLSDRTYTHVSNFLCPNDNKIALFRVKGSSGATGGTYIANFTTKSLIDLTNNSELPSYDYIVHPIGIYNNNLYIAYCIDSQNTAYIKSINLSTGVATSVLTVSAVGHITVVGAFSFMAKKHTNLNEYYIHVFDPVANSIASYYIGDSSAVASGYDYFLYWDNDYAWFTNGHKILIFNKTTKITKTIDFDNYVDAYIGSLPDSTLLIYTHRYENTKYFGKIYRFTRDGTKVAEGSEFPSTSATRGSLSIEINRQFISFDEMSTTRVAVNLSTAASCIKMKINENLQPTLFEYTYYTKSISSLYPGTSLPTSTNQLIYANPHCRIVIGTADAYKAINKTWVSCGFIESD